MVLRLMRKARMKTLMVSRTVGKEKKLLVFLTVKE